MNKENEQTQIQFKVLNKQTLEALEAIQNLSKTLNQTALALHSMSQSAIYALMAMDKMPVTNLTTRDINIDCEQMNKSVVEFKQQENEIFTEE